MVEYSSCLTSHSIAVHMKEQQGFHFIDLISEHLHITMAIILRHFHFKGMPLVQV